MKISIKAQNPLEWLALQTGLIPQPILLAHFGFLMTKVVGEAVAAGVFEAIHNKCNTPASIANQCKLNEKAVNSLLEALVGMQLVRMQQGKFFLTHATKKWFLKDGPQSYAAQILFDSQVCYNWLNRTTEFLKTGAGLQYHNTLQPQEWQLYQNAMEATSRMMSELAARKIKVPHTAIQLLDIGGAHGLYSKALLKKNPQLQAVVFDLPEAVAVNSVKPNDYLNRLKFVAGDILKDNLPEEIYDIIVMANVAHHFTEAENEVVAGKAWRALKPGGRFYILEFFKKDMDSAAGDMIGALQSFFFSFSSTSGLWPAVTIKGWLTTTNFANVRLQMIPQLPGFGLVSGKKG